MLPGQMKDCMLLKMLSNLFPFVKLKALIYNMQANQGWKLYNSNSSY